MKKGFNLFKFIREVILILLAIMCIYPLIWMILSAFKTEPEIYNSPLGFPCSLNYTFLTDVWNGTLSTPFYKFILNSFFVTIISLLFMCIIATMAAYGLSRFEFKGLKTINFFILLAMAIPLQAYFISLYVQLRDMKMVDNLFSLSVMFVTTSLPFAIIMLMGYFRSFPRSIEEAAVIDGCNELKKMIFVVVPMAKSAIATLAIINFAGYWNELLLSLLIISDNSKKTVNLGILAYRTAYSIKLGHSFAALTFSVIPVLLFFIIFQKQIIKGVTLGSLKG